jgi:hypothetical protein
MASDVTMATECRRGFHEVRKAGICESRLTDRRVVLARTLTRTPRALSLVPRSATPRNHHYLGSPVSCCSHTTGVRTLIWRLEESRILQLVACNARSGRNQTSCREFGEYVAL